MARISQATVRQHLERSRAATNNTARGRALEDLIGYLFECIPGISVTSRNAFNAFEAEEIDIAFWNDQHPRGLVHFENIILVECKNWSAPVGSAEVDWFVSKLRRRGLTFGVLVAVNGITGNAHDPTRAHSIIAAALPERIRVVVLTLDEVQTFADQRDLVLAFKRKLTDLVVAGTIVP